MAPGSPVVVQQNGTAKVKRHVPPGIQTNGALTLNTSPSPSLPNRNPPASAKQTPNSAGDRSITASTIRPIHRARRETLSSIAGRSSRNSISMRAGSCSAETGHHEGGPPPFGSLCLPYIHLYSLEGRSANLVTVYCSSDSQRYTTKIQRLSAIISCPSSRERLPV